MRPRPHPSVASADWSVTRGKQEEPLALGTEEARGSCRWCGLMTDR